MSTAMYHEVIKTLAAAAHGHGRLDRPDGSAQRDNPLCGDRVRLELRLADGHITALVHEVRGCLLCRAAAALIGLRALAGTPEAATGNARAMARLLAGEPLPEGAWPELVAFAPVAAHPSRHGCVTLPFEALIAALAAASAHSRSD